MAPKQKIKPIMIHLDIQVTPTDHKTLKAAATAAHMPLATWLRKLGLDEAARGR